MVVYNKYTTIGVGGEITQTHIHTIKDQTLH